MFLIKSYFRKVKIGGEICTSVKSVRIAQNRATASTIPYMPVFGVLILCVGYQLFMRVSLPEHDFQTCGTGFSVV